MNQADLFSKYKSSYTTALFDFSTHSILFSSSFYLLWLFRNSWASVFTVPLLGLMNIKTFMIFHDCGHNSYSPSNHLNYAIGLLLSGFVSHSFFWNYNHNTHHKINGNIENEQQYPFNEVIFHTKTQYDAFSSLQKRMYKIIKHPLFFFTIPIYFNIFIINNIRIIPFLLYHRYDCEIETKYLVLEQCISTGAFLFLLYICSVYGIFFHFISAFCIGASTTIMIVHNEHTYNPSYVVGNKEWSHKDSGLKGSSHILIPNALKYFFHGIEYHHIHHMNAKIPGYHLRNYHEEVIAKSDVVDSVVKLSMSDCYQNLWLVLYDEEKKKYITFKETEKID